jgi:capsular polysaccharide transport system permease protein
MQTSRESSSMGAELDTAPPAQFEPREPSQNPQRIERPEPFVAETDFRRRPLPIDRFESYRLHRATFVLVVLLPVLAASVYYGLWASDQYAVEIRFGVRQALTPVIADDALALLAKGLAVSTIGREPYMVANYIRSQNIVRELDEHGALRAMYSRPHIDFFARFEVADSSERLWKYWQKMVTVSVDRVSGLIMVRVLAFTADDALSIAKAVRRSAEHMVDQSAIRARADDLRAAQDDLARARHQYVDALLALRQVREGEQTVDPEKTIDATATTVVGVTRQKLALERERDTNLKMLSPSAPQIQILNQRIRALDDQLAILNRSLTSEDSKDQTAADTINRFEERELQRHFSEKLLEISQASYESARLEEERQHLYLTSFVDPVKPDKAEYPKRLRMILLTLICGVIVWGITLLLTAAVKDHKLSS